MATEGGQLYHLLTGGSDFDRGTGFVKLNASSGWSALTAALAPSLKHLTLKSNSEGGLQIPHEGMAAIGKLNALQTLTIWIKVCKPGAEFSSQTYFPSLSVGGGNVLFHSL
eukprot:1128002-Pelagomonas_calceolata.AAC.5